METIFFVSLFFVFYANVGYPIVALALARFLPKPVNRGNFEPRACIVIVAHNEEANIARKLENCLELNYPGDRLEILVASDGSSDRTEEIVAEFADQGVRLMKFEQRRGKAACLNDAISACSSEIVILADVRQIIASNAITNLARNFADDSVGAVSGELIFGNDEDGGFGTAIDAYWRYEKLIRKSESSFDSVIGATGALYAIRRTLFDPIPPGTILDDVLIPMNIVRSGARVVFEPEAVVIDTPSKNPRQERSRKIRTSAGNYQLVFGQPWLLSPRSNRLAFQYFSHKISRLLAPYFLCITLATNIVIAPRSAVYSIFLAVQLLAYFIAIAGIIWPQSLRWRIVTTSKAFLLLNWFAVLGLVEATTNRKAFLWR